MNYIIVEIRRIYSWFNQMCFYETYQVLTLDPGSKHKSRSDSKHN